MSETDMATRADTGMRASPWDIAATDPSRCALLIADTGESLTYGDMMRGADRIAGFFAAAGLREGDVVAFLLENRAAYVQLCWAAKLAGLYYVCMPRQVSEDDAAYILQNSGAALLVASAATAPVAGRLSARLAGTVRVLSLDGAEPGLEDFQAAVAREGGPPPADRRRGASMLYSSGTTGRPKGIRHPLTDHSPHQAPPRHRMLVEGYGFGPDTVFVNPGPFYHTAPLRFMMHVQRCGGTAIGFRRFDAETVLRAIDRHRATHGFFVPTHFVRMLALPEALRAACDTSLMRCAVHGAAPMPIEVKERMIAWWGPVIEEMYGGTESIGTTMIASADWLAHKGSVGRPSGSTEIRIEAPDGSECPPGVEGLVLMRTGKPFEYHGDPAKTAESQRPGGWATLGDIGYLDPEGYLYLTDRASSLIISGGVNVYPQEAENLLSVHPDVADAAVIGVPHPDLGEEVKALIVPRPGARPCADMAERLVAYCRDRLGPVKSPRSVDFVESLPRSDAGKIVKAELMRRYWPEGRRIPR
ncbi:Acyl-CoA synthetase (AMP-forming)/AMP-acid ligase II [Tistlia consotensis]|uniref:Acyl-CoA synthetase (AMP-forming)/AMP-acid ligase II n=1 Tax=Tistlia consotensis USBA 355 TaxID=560819 RepID=A0A1Y6CJ06_9PROT|nr:AMP-binding protein [Tistlia consotensis]SMF65998.1 Acyl-CoA synthetase (AMP-forming)/AMP-acid ligase II [Tistlia consotensis USBA 355]SNS02855.1 Acyl-CoA synthetase (AMP-forming)/AMP-acid ligase II [Tistlia consotensis]